MPTPSATEAVVKPKVRFRRACVRVFYAISGAILVFGFSAVTTLGLLASLREFISEFIPFTVLGLVGGVVFLSTAQFWKLVRRLWAGRYASTPRSAFFFGVCIAVASLVLFVELLPNLRIGGNKRSIVEVVFVVLTCIAAVEAEAFFVGLGSVWDGKDRHPLIALLLASSEYAHKKASLAALSTATLPP